MRHRRSTLNRDRCVVVPTYAKHYRATAGLLDSIVRFAADSVPLLIVFGQQPDVGMASVCAMAREACERLPGLEPMSIDELLSAQASLENGHARAVWPSTNLTWTAFTASGGWAKRFGRPSARAPTWMTHQLTGGGPSYSSFYTQALKKLLAVRFSECGTAWVLDSEATAIAPFRFASIFGDFERKPVAYTQRNARSVKLRSAHWEQLLLQVIARQGDDRGPNQARLLTLTLTPTLP